MSALIIETLGGQQPVTVRAAAHSAAPVVACVPALGIRAGYYELLLEALVGAGLHGVVADAPGHGDSPIRPGRDADWGYAALVDHAEAVFRAARARFPESPFFWLGHSIGGQVAVMHAGRAPEVAGVALVASGTPWVRNWRGLQRARLRLLMGLIGPLARVTGAFPGERLGFGGREAAGLMRDWRRFARSGAMRFEGLDGEALAAAVRQPIWALCLEDDDFAPPGALDHLLSKLGDAAVTRSTWLQADGGPDHNRWPRQPAVPVARLAAWINGLG